ncbi:MAG TPA: YhdT family protein [Bacillales bacterium]|nr:YhdT family protein [Bacillales bacterium]
MRNEEVQNKPKEDPRYKISHREAVIACVIAVANFIWWFGFAYGMGSKDPSQYHYVFGFPAWFFYSCILGFVVFTALVIVVVKLFYKDIPLDAEMKDDRKGGASH